MPDQHNARERWTTPADLRAQIQKLWERGDILASLVTGQPLFPRRFPLKAPTSREIAECFADVRSWAHQIQTTPHCRVETRELRHRLMGVNHVPAAIWIDSVEDALARTGRRREAQQFLALVEAARREQPELLAWLARRPFQALEFSEDWERLLKVVAWVKEHPHPRVYLRQVDIPGIHTKFLETHRGVLSELLDIALPPDAIDCTSSGVTEFAKRYGFLERPTSIRFRVLDRECALLPGGREQEITLDVESFARLEPRVSRIFVTENEVNFLAFPDVRDSLIIFGKGYGFRALARAGWLSRCSIYYWGDIDTHGFAILDQLRGELDAVQSFLMDRATLMKFESLWGVEEQQTVRELGRLNDEERALYDDLRDNRIRKNLRLEQERVGFRWVEFALTSFE
ncbi:MAG: hypothetical protein J2P13_02595 [Acidobacteria bacterium]|nr:hypothetical protein [Acidobacteriota bacterium]